MKHEIDKYGCEFWKDDLNEFHREDGPAVIAQKGSKFWYKHGKYHRIGYPAIIWHNENEEWWVDGNRHRLDGPAFTSTNGLCRWWINGEQIYCKDNEEFLRIVKMKNLL
jgi:hypothetical protein